MHLHFERNTNAKCDCTILSLTWMGKVPDELPEDEGWKLNRTNYYQEGWLATGNVRGIVGVTFTTSHCRKGAESPLRTNYNLRGHRSEVILVKWNEPYQKLASCDSSGIIFVWIKYEGRWSIELINDRNTPVTHFSWSHDGRMALICYQDGFVLVGSVAGQRYWSSMLNLESTITCGIWTPDDQQVYFGTTSGQIIVMDVHGAMVSQVQLPGDVAITEMAWSCEKFKMEESDEQEGEDRVFVLAVCLKNGFIYLMKNFDDVSPIQVHTGLCGINMEWSNSRELLAVAGTTHRHSSQQPSQGPSMSSGPHLNASCHSSSSSSPPSSSSSSSTSPSSSSSDEGRSRGHSLGVGEYANVLKFYSEAGILLYCVPLPYSQAPVTALTWGHNDKRLYIATGCQVHIAWVSRRVASLQLMCRLQVHGQLRSDSQVSALPLPPRIKALISTLFAQTIRCCVPEPSQIRGFVSRPPVGNVRLHCTMIRHDDDNNLSSGTCYTLYLEYLGGLVPLLKGKRTSKIRPEFVIFDPQVDEASGVDNSGSSSTTASEGGNWKNSGAGGQKGKSGASGGTPSRSARPSDDFSSDTDYDEGCATSPRVQRRRRKRRKSRSGESGGGSGGGLGGGATGDLGGVGGGVYGAAGLVMDPVETDDLTYVDTLPEHARLVEVTSNIWGTKFKIHGLAPSLPANLGQVTYKTSLLHLQPRQMTLAMTELRDDILPGPDPNFNPNLFSEDEEEVFTDSDVNVPPGLQTDIAPIAPMSPRSRATGRRCSARPESMVLPSPTLLEDGPSENLNPDVRVVPCRSHHDADSPYNNMSVAPEVSDFRHTPRVPSGAAAYDMNHSSVCPMSSPPLSPSTHNGSQNTCDRAQSVQPQGSLTPQGSPKRIVAPCELSLENATTMAEVHMPASISGDPYGSGARRRVKGNLLVKPQEEQDYPERNRTIVESSGVVGGIHGRAPMQRRRERQHCSKQGGGNYQVAATKWTGNPEDVKFIDDEGAGVGSGFASSSGTSFNRERNSRVCGDLGGCVGSGMGAAPTTDPMVRSCSVGYLDLVEARSLSGEMSGQMKEAPKRLVLIHRKKERPKPKLRHGGKSRSLDSSDIFNRRADVSDCKGLTLGHMSGWAPRNKMNEGAKGEVRMETEPIERSNMRNRANGEIPGRERPEKDRVESFGSGIETIQTRPPLPRGMSKSAANTPQLQRRAQQRERGSATTTSGETSAEEGRVKTRGAAAAAVAAALVLNTGEQASASGRALLMNAVDGLCCPRSLPPLSPTSRFPPPHSSPSSPALSKKSKRNQSPSPIRKHLLNSPLLSRRQRKSKTTESSDDEIIYSGDEIFNGKNYKDLESFQKAQLRQKLKRGKFKGENGDIAPPVCHRREFVMHNKAPMWNENSQVYQLDFGGRVTQESAKNFQIEFRGKQVMQFGRIDGNAYTLDFQYPFSALQAFAVALANVTQRLK
ncbi:tubby-related protein 4 isoform X2 [Hetaerina americana]|uniref:tubby-related protein 4 isoform X2 n=1 Tax=Hetaerina americana TaxID=62018 RepID=UPI003A7F3AF9